MFNYGIDVLLVRSKTSQGPKIKAFPDPNYIIAPDDFLVVAGEIGKLNLLKSMI